ncbi:Zinc finger CCHC domain-containing protein 9 [Bagarius yarrelli]|uniref:Zinc finger CCHC domain-containing protein 9 n=1 Tax=Bagarius yarrelli TaxID=175774 RepID=A0A556VC82_BAGYA|nr:Zinc finger CCHC domain-containing protein 9 [Bagarius yarrelli]
MTRWAKHVNKHKSVNAASWSQLRAGIAGRPNSSASRSRDNTSRRSSDGKEADKNSHDVNGFMEYLKHKRNPLPNGRQRVKPEEQDLREALTTALKKNNRREGRRIKRQNAKKSSMVCFNCRKPGHGLADCPKADDEEMGRGICFRCGSTEHEIQRCRAKVDPAMGGCCRICGSVEHFQKDCPDHQTTTKSITLGRLSDRISADHEDISVSVPHVARKKVKVVTY